MAETHPIIAVIDTPPEAQTWRQVLTVEGYQVESGDHQTGEFPQSPAVYLVNQAVGKEKCAALLTGRPDKQSPVILLAQGELTLEQAQDFCPGVVEILYPPIEASRVLEAVERALEAKGDKVEARAAKEQGPAGGPGPETKTALLKLLDDQFSSFLQFREHLQEQLSHAKNASIPPQFNTVLPQQLYQLAPLSGITEQQLAKRLAEFLGFPFTQLVDRSEVRANVLPPTFAHTHFAVPTGSEGETVSFVISNPFDFELLDVLKNLAHPNLPELIITEPKTISELLSDESVGELDENLAISVADSDIESGAAEGKVAAKHPIIYITDRILNAAVTEGASDVHIEPKENLITIRFRIDGDLEEKFTLKKKTGMMLISRLKAIANMDIAEHRKPQDGAAEANIAGRQFVLRLATTSTVYGESLVFRILDRNAEVLTLEQLGMSPQQAENMTHFANSVAGLLLVVGPTGSGKTTTLYSLFSLIDCRTRSLISVEDPVEYRIAFANQQQVNDKAGITFQALLKSAVRQDPDILFMGEVRDGFSAQTAIEFTSIGHLALTTLHTSSATSAIFRLEELGITRMQMADSLLGIVSQRLIKRLCEQCKEARPIKEEERRVLALITDDPPATAYYPVGCPACNFSGYRSREGIYEVIRIDATLSEAIRKGLPIGQLRRIVRERGELLMSQHALEKIRQGVLTPRDVEQYIFMEADSQMRAEDPSPQAAKLPEATANEAVAPSHGEAAASQPLGEDKNRGAKRLLVVDDEAVTRKLLTRLVENAGYQVVACDDGIDALLKIGGEHFDLIITDINMPNLDGFSLLEMLNQKGVATPVLFVTGSNEPEDEQRGLTMGAADFVRKPIQKEILLARIERSLRQVSLR
jgi:type IV pilus assembly protein PilB